MAQGPLRVPQGRMIVSPGLTIMAATAALTAMCACAPEPNPFDRFPVNVDLSSGALVAGLTVAGQSRAILVDPLSPFTRLDPDQFEGVRGGQQSLTLQLGEASDTGLGNSRAEWKNVEAIGTKVCPAPPCTVGTLGSEIEVSGILGADVLGRQATIVDFSASTLTFNPALPGSTSDRTHQCEATFPNAFAGGGTALVNGAEIRYGRRRPAVVACMNPPGGAATGGTDMLFIVSTGLGETLITETAYARLAGDSGLPRLDELPEGRVNLSGGSLTARFGQVDTTALVGRARERRSPCEEVRTNWAMRSGGCTAAGLSPCLCEDGNFCKTGAVVLINRPIDIAIVSDEEPLFQSLRDELRPQFAEVDGLLGTRALLDVRMAFDLPANRLIATCTDAATCLVVPEVVSQETLDLCPVPVDF